MNCLEINPYKRYVQFNDLVIDSADMVLSASYSQDTKTETEEYSYGHGSYYRLPAPQQFLTEAELSMTLHIDYRRVPRESRKYLKDFIKMELLKGGKLWAIENNTLVWAYAFVTSFGEEYTLYKGFYSIDVDFMLPEGLWHFADKMNTYLLPHDSCLFLDMYDFRDVNECGDNCCRTNCNNRDAEADSCWWNCVSQGDSLCEIVSSPEFDISAIFQNCGKSYRIVYDCLSGEKYFGDRNLGVKISKADICKNVIAGRFYSNTVIDTTNVEITLTGHWTDPTIEINGVKMTISGEYDGTLKIHADGTVDYYEGDCCTAQEVSLDDVSITDFGFTVHHGMNRVIVEGGCCSAGSIYIKSDELTN